MIRAPIPSAMLLLMACFGTSTLARDTTSPQAVVEALMKVSATAGELHDDEVSFGIEEYGTLRIRVAGGVPHAERVDESPVVTWHPFTAMRVLFGPLPPLTVTALPREVAALQAWCPLPLSWPIQDAV